MEGGPLRCGARWCGTMSLWRLGTLGGTGLRLLAAGCGRAWRRRRTRWRIGRGFGRGRVGGRLIGRRVGARAGGWIGSCVGRGCCSRFLTGSARDQQRSNHRHHIQSKSTTHPNLRACNQQVAASSQPKESLSPCGDSGLRFEVGRIVAATWASSVRKACQTIPYSADNSMGPARGVPQRPPVARATNTPSRQVPGNRSSGPYPPWPASTTLV